MVNGAESERVQFRAGNVEEEAAQLGRGKTCTADNRRKEHALIVQRASHCALAQLLPADCTEHLRVMCVPQNIVAFGKSGNDLFLTPRKSDTVPSKSAERPSVASAAPAARSSANASRSSTSAVRSITPAGAGAQKPAVSTAPMNAAGAISSHTAAKSGVCAPGMYKAFCWPGAWAGV